MGPLEMAMQQNHDSQMNPLLVLQSQRRLWLVIRARCCMAVTTEWILSNKGCLF